MTPVPNKPPASSYDPSASATITRAQAEGLPYRLGVGVMLLNADDRVFVAQRLDMRSQAWQMPQGGMDPGETPAQTAFRELREETGTDKASLLAETADWFTYDLPLDLVPKLWGGHYRGQRQKWFAMRFLGRDADIDIAGPNPEFSEWRWAAFESLPELIVPFKRSLYARLLDEFRPLLQR
jgi:putative (di)nucleoside polyphosphate hydrolase